VRTIFDINLFYDKFIMHTSGRELCSLFWVPTVIVKCRTAIKVVFLHLILLLSAMLDIQIHLHPSNSQMSAVCVPHSSNSQMSAVCVPHSSNRQMSACFL
jgi:hypothetical protein